MSKKLRFTLKFSLISALIAIFVAFLAGMLILFVVKSRAALEHTASKIMTEVTRSVDARIQNLVQPIDRSVVLSSRLVKSSILPMNNKILLTYSYQVLKLIPQAKMVYFAKPDGTFLISRRLGNDNISSEEIVTTNSQTMSTVLMRDKSGNITSTKTTATQYDPRSRSWYKNAVRTAKPVWSDPYVFATGGVLGVTRSAPIYSQSGKLLAVVGVDMTLQDLSTFIAKLNPTKNSKILVMNRNGGLVGYPEMTGLLAKINGSAKPTVAHIPDAPVNVLAAQYLKARKASVTNTVDENNYIATFTSVAGFKQENWVVGIVTPVADFIGAQKEKLMESIYLGIGMMLVCVIFIWWFGNKFSKRIEKVSDAMREVSQLNLEPNKNIGSRITEVDMIEHSLAHVKHGLRSFEKYVPAKLVKQLIIEHKSANLGGEKKRLALFFSDIKNFTNISEGMMPTPLLEHICDYLEMMTHTIWDNKGTIDKFIGDAVMAFWGAPVPSENMAYNACMAALNVQKNLSQKNAEWEANAKPALPTRIGLHVGDVIVGNMGSSDRLNYTVLGDSVNLASRLEAIGKVYSCYIVASESIHKEVKDDFIFCPLDVLAVKGKNRPVKIYELIATAGTECDIDYVQYEKDFDRCFALYAAGQFEEALQGFRQMRAQYDRVVLDLSIERCEYLMENTPENWDGVWRYTTK